MGCLCGGTFKYSGTPNFVGRSRCTFFSRRLVMAQKAQAIPKGHHTVTPSLFVAGAAKAIEFYKNALGAEEVSRFPGPDGKIMHAEIRVGDSPIMLADEM